MKLRTKILYLLGFLYIVKPEILIKAQSNIASDSAIISHIQLNLKEKLQFLDKTPRLNTIMSTYLTTPLVAAIQNNKPQIVKYLLSIGADPNQAVNGKTPLVISIENDKPGIVKYLLKSGAEVNTKDKNGITPLMAASKKMSLKTIRQIINHGAWLNSVTQDKLSAIHFAQAYNNKPIVNYLYHLFEKRLPDYSDGPYISYKKRNEVEVQFFRYDSLPKKYSRIQNIISLQNQNTISINAESFIIKDDFQRSPTNYNGINKMFVFGDIHGQCDSLKKFLIKQQITDTAYNWTFGDGHLVFVGDILDRGNQVTEALWLLYKLDLQAPKYNGKVHILLGNHELMEMEGNTKYNNEKYHYLFKRYQLEYKKMFTPKTVLGRWLRSKNSIEILDSTIFVHAGLHPELLKLNLSPDSINKTIHTFLNTKSKKNIDPIISFLLSNNGIFWYRDLIQNKSNTIISEKTVSDIIHYYNVSTIIVGHTLVPNIKSYYNKKIIAVNVPYYQMSDKQFEALFIDKTGFYRITSTGYQEKF